MSIKVIEGLKPWEVMKMAEEGKRTAFRTRKGGGRVTGWRELRILIEPPWNWGANEYAIIDDTKPEMSWDFDWEFFNQYGGLHIERDGGAKSKIHSPPGDGWSVSESPLYPWAGGKCPVPGNVEVETIVFYGVQSCESNEAFREIQTLAASNVEWDHGGLAAFRIT